MENSSQYWNNFYHKCYNLEDLPDIPSEIEHAERTPTAIQVDAQ